MDKNNGGLKRELGLTMLIFYGVGTILGLGIYVLIGKISEQAGMLSPFAVFVSAIIAGFTGLSYSELSARIPKSAGEVNYVEAGFSNKYLSTLVGWMIVLSAMISTATVVNGYVGYVQVFVNWPGYIIIILIVLGLGTVAAWGIRESAILIAVITLVELSGILLVIIVGADKLAIIPENLDQLIPSGDIDQWRGIAAASFLAFFAFIGFEDMVNISEEARNPVRDMPRAIIISFLILSVLYILVALIANLSMSQNELGASSAPLADIVAAKNPGYAKLASSISLVAIVNGVLVQIIMCARVMYGMAEIKMAPAFLHEVHPKTRTPLNGTLLTVIVVLLLALNFELENLAKATNFVLLSVFMIVNLALISIKRKDPAPQGLKSLPYLVPLCGFIFSLLIMLLELISYL
jgi:amino acid transporter